MNTLQKLFGKKETHSIVTEESGTVIYQHREPTEPKFKIGDVLTYEYYSGGRDSAPEPTKTTGAVVSMKWNDYSWNSYWTYVLTIKGFKILQRTADEDQCYKEAIYNRPSESRRVVNG